MDQEVPQREWIQHTSVIDDGEILRVNLRPLFVSDSKLFREFDHLVKGFLSLLLILAPVFREVIETNPSVSPTLVEGDFPVL